MFDDNELWGREKWVGNWCFSVHIATGGALFGLDISLDPHPEGVHSLALGFGFLYLGLQIFGDQP